MVGAKNEGVSGFFKGLGAGVLGAVVLPTMGVVNGVMEIGGGIANTPEVRMERREEGEGEGEGDLPGVSFCEGSRHHECSHTPSLPPSLPPSLLPSPYRA